MPGAVGFSNRAVSAGHGAACAVGAILARLAAANTNASGSRAWAALSEDALPSALSFVAAAIGHPVSLLHVAACGAIGRVGAVGPLPVRSTDDRDINGTEGGGRTAAAMAETAASGEGGEDRITTVQAVFERLWAACRPGETTDASRRAEAAADALGRCCRGGGRGIVEEARTTGNGKAFAARVCKSLSVLFDMAKNQVGGVEASTSRARCGRKSGSAIAC